MLYECFELKAVTAAEALTEILFEIASRRAGGAELLRIDIRIDADEKKANRLFRSVNKILRDAKAKKLVQFFAFPDNFESMGTEARFLTNKYPEIFEVPPEVSAEHSFVYVKI